MSERAAVQSMCMRAIATATTRSIKEHEHQDQGDDIPPVHNSASASEPRSNGPDQDDKVHQ